MMEQEKEVLFLEVDNLSTLPIIPTFITAFVTYCQIVGLTRLFDESCIWYIVILASQAF